jgi:hypothetical protein
MTAYSDLQTSAASVDTAMDTLTAALVDLADKAAVYETSVRTGGKLEGDAAAAQVGNVVRQALVKSCKTGGATYTFILRALRMPLNGAGSLAASYWP